MRYDAHDPDSVVQNSLCWHQISVNSMCIYVRHIWMEKMQHPAMET